MKTIFLLEPDPVIARDCVTALQDNNKTVISFRSASTCIRALEKVVPDMIVMELAVPAHNGFEFLYELRSYGDTKHVRVVVFSCLAESSVNFSYVAKQNFGIVAYVDKVQGGIAALEGAINEYL